MRSSTIMLSSSGRRVELSKVLSDEGHSVVSVDASARVPTRYSSSAFEKVPLISCDDFIESVISVCRKNQVEILIPTIDTELRKYSSAREKFRRAEIDLWVSDSAAVELAQDKLAFFQTLSADGRFPVISTESLETFQSEDALYPIFVKPRFGSGSQRAFKVSSAAGWPVIDDPFSYVAQPFIEGTEYTVDFAVGSDGTLRGISCRERLAVSDGEVVVATTRSKPRLESVVEDLIAAVPGLYGLLNLQFIETDDGPKILELNARVGGGFPLSVAAGCNLVTAMLQAPGQPPMGARPGVTMLRYDSSYFVDEPGASIVLN